MANSTAGARRIFSGADAVAWAWRQELPPGEKLLLLAITDNAGRGGVWLFGAQREMADQTGMGVRTVARHLATLEGRGLIRREATYERGERVPDHIALVVENDLPANLAGSGSADSAANGANLPANLADGQFGRAGSSSTARSINGKRGKVKKEARGQIGRQQIDALPQEMQDDVSELLKQRKTVDRRVVTEREMLIAAAALAEFNRQAESDYGLGANLRAVVMRARERPSWDAAKHVRLVQSAWRFRWWERTGSTRRATPAVIYGEKAFENVVQDAADEAAGRRVPVDLDPRTKVYDGRPWDTLMPGEQASVRASLQMGIVPWARDVDPDALPAPRSNGSNGGYTAENILEGD